MSASLSERINALPVILAGPILRRTEPNAVTVWVALRESRSVTLEVYDGPTSGDGTLLSQTNPAVKIGEKLFIACITASQSSPVLQPAKIYSYDLIFDDGHLSDLLNSPGSGQVEPYQIDITYGGFQLPTFVLPPADLNDLHLIHASCRKPHGESLDAFAALDAMIESAVTDANNRPHQLFLTGDQIYADDVADPLLLMLTDAGTTLLGWPEEETLPGINKKPSEIRPGAREDIAEDECGFTSSDAKSHLFGIAEYFAMYLFCWSDVLWPSNLPTFEDVFPDESKTKIVPTIGTIETSQFRDFKEQSARLERFRQDLPGIRRAMANIPIYMIFDDHEITDDWYLHQEWCEEVLGKPLGKRVIQNGLLAYALFQAWGNTPAQFTAGTPGAALLAAASAWRGAADGNEAIIAQRVGMPDLDSLKANKKLLHSTEALDWHYTITGPTYQVLVLDVRTWRGFPDDKDDPPALLTEEAFERQIPDQITPIKPLTFVVSPAPVVGAPVTDFIKDVFSIFSSSFVDYEDWRLQKAIVEQLYARLALAASTTGADRKARIVLLCGDIHYGYALRLQYWATHPFERATPVEVEAIFAQVTSSALKNQEGKTRLFHNVGYYPIVNLPSPRKWAGWNLPPDPDQVQTGTNVSSAATASDQFFFQQKPWLLRERPAMLSLTDLPSDSNITAEPDWRYRIDFLVAENDVREPAPFDPRQIPPPTPGESREDALARYLVAAEDHEDYAKKWGDGKEIVGVNNIGEITVSWPDEDENKAVVQQLWWRLESRLENEEDESLLNLFPLTKHIISLHFDDAQYPKPTIG